MANTYTLNYNLTKPEVGADTNLWGTHLNADLDAIDGQMKTNADAAAAAATTANAAIPKAGGTMTGYLTLSGAPTSSLHAVTKTYADGFVPLAGGTMTGSLILSGAPTTSLQAATKSYVDTTSGSYATPTGAILPFGMSTAPTGWLSCDGSAVSRTSYSNLFSAIGTLWGTGDGSSTFNVPDLRGAFLRGWDNGKGLDTSTVYGVTTNGSNVISSLSSTLFMYVGMPVSGSGIPVGATVASIISSSQITISVNATATSIPSSTQTGTLGGTQSATITGLSSTSGLVVGQGISGTGIPTGSTIQIINSSTSITTSAIFTASGSITITFAAVPTALTFTGRAFASYQADAYQNHSHPVTDIGHLHASTSSRSGIGNSGSQADVPGVTPTGVSPTGLLVNNSTTGGPETRPKNYAILYCIKI